MLFSWWRRRRRRKLLDRPAEPIWVQTLQQLRVLSRLDAGARDRLIDIARVFASEKKWMGCNGFRMTEEAKVVVSLQAALLILERPHDYFRSVDSVLLYPSAFRNPHARAHGDGSISEGSINAGEAWHRGPIIL
ncbi:MAG: zinc-dependent peptidase, partial [Planctomycetes bacterium]|nr:zinc-dependent peptidase [Planctomycetota bacterium]